MLLTSEPQRGGAGEELLRQNAELEQENARLRALLSQAGDAAALVAESETKWRLLFEQAVDGIVVSDNNGRYLEANDAACRMLGYERHELLSLSISKIVAEEERARIAAETGRVGDETNARGEWRLRRKDGSIFIGEVIGRQVSDGRFQAFVRDVTERIEADERLRSSEAFARTVLEASPDCLKVIGVDGKVEYINQNGACLLELEGPNSVIGRPWESLWPDALGPMIRRSLEAARSGRLIEFTAEGPTAKGTPKHWDVSIAAIPGQDGQPVRLLAASRDVTEKIRSEMSLADSEARYRAAVEAVDGIVWTNDASGEMSGEQPGWSALTGQTPAEYQGFGWSQAVHPDDAQPTIDAWNAAVAARSLFEFEHRVRRHDGAWGHFSIRAVPIMDAGNRITQWVGVHTDISAQKASEAHRELLMGELAHRTKNQLAVVQAVAGQTARGAATLEEFRTIFDQRLGGMAASADLLIAQNWEGAPLGELVDRQLEPFGAGEGRLECDGPDVFLGSDATEAIGLALHELGTNCIKYGAWSVPGGTVRVVWSLVRDGAQPPQLRLNWTERGGPVVAEPTRKGFGRMMIERMVAQKLDGSVEAIFDVKGLSWTLRVPPGQFTAAPLTAVMGSVR